MINAMFKSICIQAKVFHTIFLKKLLLFFHYKLAEHLVEKIL